MNKALSLVACALVVSVTNNVMAANNVIAQDELARQASWHSEDYPSVQSKIDTWINVIDLDPAKRLQVESLWEDESPLTESTQLLEQVVATIMVVHPEFQPILETVQQNERLLTAPSLKLLEDERFSPFVRNNLKLYVGGWLAQRELYDEALKMLEPAKIDEVVDRASLLFYRGIGYQRLLKKDECITTLELLLENKETIPQRYQRVATLVLADLRPLEKDSLDEVARLMEDIERRQGLFRSGKTVRKEEDDVLAKLDKMIKEIEDKMKESQSSSPSSGSSPSGNPAEDSFLPTQKGAGEVDSKDQPVGKSWGDLPAAKKAESMTDLESSLPTHYRFIIMEYLKKLADDDASRIP